MMRGLSIVLIVLMLAFFVWLAYDAVITFQDWVVSISIQGGGTP